MTIKSKLKSLPAGTVTVTSTTVVDGETVTATKEIGYEALKCK